MTDEATDIRAIRAAGVAGLVFAALVHDVARASSARTRPRDGAERHPGRAPGTPGSSALYLIPFAGIAFLWFLAALRRRIGRLEDQFFATVFLGSGLLFVAMLFAAGAAASAAWPRPDGSGTDPTNQAGLRVRAGAGRDSVLRLRREDGGGVHARLVDHRPADAFVPALARRRRVSSRAS